MFGLIRNLLGSIIASLLFYLLPYGSGRKILLRRIGYLFSHPTKSSQTVKVSPPKAPMAVTSRCQQLLFIEDRIPDPIFGGGFPRTFKMLELLSQSGVIVTYYPVNQVPDPNGIAAYFRNLGVEMICSENPFDIPSLSEVLDRPDCRYSAIIVSRPYLMKCAWPVIRKKRRAARVIYDAEAIFAYRIIQRRRLEGKPYSKNAELKLVNSEIRLAKQADAVLCVSSLEKKRFVSQRITNIQVIRHVIKTEPTAAPFHKRSDLLFVGSLMVSPSPNVDTLQYFKNDVLPVLLRTESLSLTIAGIVNPSILKKLESPQMTFIGSVQNLRPVYESHRVFIAPTRYAGGVPLKVLEAAAYGIPCVVTPLLAEQLEWKHEQELLVGDSPAAFAEQCIRLYNDEKLWNSLRANALARVHEECSEEIFNANLLEACGLISHKTALQ